MSIVASSPPSSSALEDLSTQLQHASPKQTGTLIIDHSGAVLAASGDCKETADRLATCMLTLMRDTNGVFVHSRPTNAKAKEELARMTIAFKTYQYAISLTQDLVICVKSNLD